MDSYTSALDMFNSALQDAPTFDFTGVISSFTEENALFEKELWNGG